MGVPSSPGWKFGYVPSPGEWNNTFAGKVDYPAPVDQGGTGGQTSADGNYNLQQRFEVITTTQKLAPLSFYSLRTDLTAMTLTLPKAGQMKAGDWILAVDTGGNAAVNNVTFRAAEGDQIISAASTVTSLLLQTNFFQIVLVSDGDATWRTGVVILNGGGGGGGGGIVQPIPRLVDGTSYTLQLSDAGQYLQFTSDDPVTVSVPASTAISFTLGSVVVIEQYGLGPITIAPDPGVTVNGHNSLRSGGQYAVMQLKSGSAGSYDIWTLLGDALP